MEDKRKSENEKSSNNEDRYSECSFVEESSCFEIVDACGCRVIDPCGCYSSCSCC